ncbi:SIS domain-containing protein [[Eubacterium] cellulosolvens]
MQNTIEAMHLEIKNQIEDLPSYVDYLEKLALPPEIEREGKRCIFTGAGDSYAASIAVEALSRRFARGLDPYDLLRNPSDSSDLHLYIISVSGKTKSNIQAAKATRGFAKELTAISANLQSPLARTTDNFIQLKFRSEGKLTPGTSSFTTSLLASFSRVQNLPNLAKLSDVYDAALSWSENIEIPLNATTFLVGTGLTYPLAIYGKAKIYETLGSKSNSQRTEQFSHMELFSLRKDDLVIIMPEKNSDDQAIKLHNLLAEQSFKTLILNPNEHNEIERSIASAIYLQVLTCKNAEIKGIKECAFINRTNLLDISDKMIYQLE